MLFFSGADAAQKRTFARMHGRTGWEAILLEIPLKKRRRTGIFFIMDSFYLLLTNKNNQFKML
jgi:hypothetical protein